MFPIVWPSNWLFTSEALSQQFGFQGSLAPPMGWTSILLCLCLGGPVLVHPSMAPMCVSGDDAQGRDFREGLLSRCWANSLSGEAPCDSAVYNPPPQATLPPDPLPSDPPPPWKTRRIRKNRRHYRQGTSHCSCLEHCFLFDLEKG